MGMCCYLGHLVVTIAFGSILGRFLSEGGAAQRIAMTLVDKLGKKRVGWAIALTGFVLGITLFWEVRFMILMPIIFTVAIAAELPLLKVAIPMLSVIIVIHCFLPLHPDPTAAAGIFVADPEMTFIYGLIIAISAVDHRLSPLCKITALFSEREVIKLRFQKQASIKANWPFNLLTKHME